MASKFKVGDKVVRAGPNFDGVRTGDIVEISKILPDGHLFLKGFSGAYDQDFFELCNTFKNYKFRVRNSKHSKMIQMKLFELGYKWAGHDTRILHTDRPFLFAEADGTITHSQLQETFDNDPSVEMEIKSFTTYNLVEAPVPVQSETVELNGKTYLKADLEAALAKLTPMQKPVSVK